MRPAPFQEDEWLGCVLSFGEGDDAPTIAATMRDERCSMVNIDPDSASIAPEVMKAVVRRTQNNAGIYGAVTRTGRLAVGQTLSFVQRRRTANLRDRSAMGRSASIPQAELHHGRICQERPLR
jgi:hypothetical protein